MTDLQHPERLRTTGPGRFAVHKTTLLVPALALLWFISNGGLYRFGPVNMPLWLLAYITFSYWAVTNYGKCKRLLYLYYPILVVPFIAILSTSWSIDPGRSAFAGIQLLMTVLISLLIRETFTTIQIFLALAISQVTGFVLSLLNMAVGFLPPVYEVNGALLGIYTHKTGMGKTALWGAFAITALCILRRIPLVGALTIVATFPFTRMAASTTASLGYVFIALMIILCALRRHRAELKMFLIFAPLVLTMSFVAIYSLTNGDILADSLLALGKSSTLTGRTVLWAIGYEIWSESPWLGIGFQSFWHSPAYADVVNWIWAYVDDGLNGFHNAYIEALVAFGLFGFVPFVFILLYTGFSLFRWYMERKSSEAAIWLCAFMATALLALMDDSFFKMHTGHFMLAVMAYATAVQENRKRSKR